MRKRLIVAGLAVVLTAAGGLAYADPFSNDGSPPSSAVAQAPIITLPTGDRVRASADGALIPMETNGKLPQFLSPRLAGGDRILIPRDSLDDVANGDIDDRLFNIDALLRHGYTDARDVASPGKLGTSLLDDDATAAAGGTAKVTVEFSWKDGTAPDEIAGGWADLAGDKRDLFMENGDSAAVELPPGEYAFQAAVFKGDDIIMTVFDLTVTDADTTVTVDGRKGKRVKFAVDADDAIPGYSDFNVFSDPANGEGTATGALMRGSDKAYAIPSKKITGHKAGLILQSELSSPSGGSKPCTYSLFEVTEQGIPAKPTFTVHDDELAARKATYHKLGAKATMERGNLAGNENYPPLMYAPSASAKLGSTRTEYYSTTHDVAWSHLGSFPGPGEEPTDDVLHHSGKVSPGSKKAPWLSAPLSVGVSDPAFPYYGSGVRRMPNEDGTDVLAVSPPMFTSGSGDEIVISYGGKGSEATLSKDGTELASEKEASVAAPIPSSDKGRYTATFDIAHGADWTPLGTRSTATWKFDSAPVTDETPLAVSAVRFNASGVKDGYADVAKPQKVNLEYVTQPGATDRDCVKLTFAVSYDDGKTWKSVTVDRDGDKATAKLKHPKNAKFVSVKFSAKDDKGQTVKHATIRSYGLK